ncbi:MAG: hypothetical protein MR450_10740 [Prevotella sp.]|nr:hypothetical protein [Prevotella sp.]MDY4039209.1 hypothetical protein [Prevotella sp.]
MYRWMILLLWWCCLPLTGRAEAQGAHGMYSHAVPLRGMISPETGEAPVAYLWLPDGNAAVRAVIVAQQNMTEEALFRMTSFQREMRQMGVAIVWVAPAFSKDWDPASDCQRLFDGMMADLAAAAGHPELRRCPVIPLGHSAHATFPWNFAAWNNDRTLCIISLHGDAPRTNLTGYGGPNVEWGRQRNIDGIPGLMIEGEYEWWEARVRPALAFRMMYPESCISFLCDAGQGHFDLSEPTAAYIARFIRKSMEQRLQADGTLRKVNPADGWLCPRFVPDLPQTDGPTADSPLLTFRPVPSSVCAPAPYRDYQGDRHDAFWYFDREMAEMTALRYAGTRGKKRQYVGFRQAGKLIPYDEKVPGGMQAAFLPEKDGITFRLTPVYTDSTHAAPALRHGTGRLHIEVICGPVEKLNDTTFRVRRYEAGWNNPRRSFTIWLVAMADADAEYKGAVQPLRIQLPQQIKALFP